MSGEKTERPTPHRLRKAREDGQVAKSKDFTQTLLLASLFGYTISHSGAMAREFGDLMTLAGSQYEMEFGAALSMVGSQALRSLASMTLPYILIVLAVGVFAEMIQVGVLFAFKTLVPKGDRLNPVQNLQQMFSKKSFVEFFKSIAKVLVLSAIVWKVLREALDPLLKVPTGGIEVVALALVDVLKTMVIQTFLCYGAIALFDFVYQRASFIKSQMMSHDEIKQEYKQLEGDPHVKGHRKELAKEIAMGEGVEGARSATAVITNPTHLAVAIFFDEARTPLPVVLCKGADAVAKEIVRVATEEGIPIMQNIPVARALWSQANVGKYIPSELIAPVAEVLLALRRRAAGRGEEELP